MINIGIIGCGYWGPNLLRNFEDCPNACVKMVAELDPERIEYVQGLWNFIAQSPDRVVIPESHKQVLDQRLANNVAEPNATEPWDQARDNILKNLRNT